jgi:hypothetical protein
MRITLVSDAFSVSDTAKMDYANVSVLVAGRVMALVS